MANKALTIDVNSAAIPSGTLDQWSQLGNTSVFIKNIITPKLSAKTDVGQLVSGIPTAFARVDLFKTALDHVATSGNQATTNNLVGYYSRLADEWRGLIACMALDYAHISVRRIDLAYSDGKDVAHTANVYEPKGAFGNMLLRRRDRWCDQNLTDNQTPVPYVNVIKYRGQVVGATAPESLLFTSTGYHCEPSDECPWVDVATRKFIDPLRSTMKPQQIAVLHAYVSHLLNGLGKVEEYYQKQGSDYTSIRTILQTWKGEIEQRAASDGIELSIGSTPPVSAGFSEPFAEMFCHKDELNGCEGVISDNEMQGGVKFDPKNLLLDDNAHIAKLNLNISPDDYKNLPILVLSADVKGMGGKAYFALPLSAQGLNVFGKNVAALVGMSVSASAIKSTLKAVYDPSQKTGNLEVVLTLVTDSGIQRQFKKIYTSDGSIQNKDILIWPNFISPQWDSYFMYNELTHNGTSNDFRAFPFVGHMDDDNYFRILVDNEQAPVLLSKDGKITVPDNLVKAELMVLSSGAIADNPYKYEIYRADKPFKGVRLLSPTGNEGGYLLINYSSEQGTNLPHNWMLPGAHTVSQKVRLGIDFGSTNTSIAYSSNNTREQGFVFHNQRVSLLGNEMPGKPLFPRENQVFFFQGAGSEVKSNAIKSVLTLHDNRRLPALSQGQTLKMRDEREVVGGFPSFADNLPFTNSEDNRITLCYPNGVGEVTQIHNMKWEDTDEDKAHKSAFLRTLMLHVYATLFVDGFVPESVKWSYPSAMAGQLLYSYQNIWDSLRGISPVRDAYSKETIALNVSKYVDTRSLKVNSGSPFSSTQGGFGATGSGFSGFGGGFGNTQGGFGAAGDGFGGSQGGFSGGFGNTQGGFGAAGSDSFGGSEGGFGTAGSGFGGGFGSPKSESCEPEVDAKEFMPDDPKAEVVYDPKPFYNSGDNVSLSEAEAVANFISTKYGKEANVLNLCFDVGGSTTDISALFLLKGGITMIKQNSLRFAAQRVSQAVAQFQEFKRVLSVVCSRHGIKMLGLNFGGDTYNERTAPYFFDQIVNRLDDNQLCDFYKSIAAECPRLMCVNLYVTGLLMYYAGQIAHKLIDDLKRTKDWDAPTKPIVRVTFAGKGSRLFQWLNAINPGAATQYYGQQFVLGFGEVHLKETLADWQRIELPGLNDQDIKFEVSKGLAKGDTILQRPQNPQPSEIIGESGFDLVGNDSERRPIEFTNSITSTMMESIGDRLSPTNCRAEKFTDFCGFFYTAANQLFNWNANPQVLQSACQSLNITGYVQQMPEFREAQQLKRSGKSFDFVAPIIILEGMEFYDNTLLKLMK